jgi:hypothetical protein
MRYCVIIELENVYVYDCSLTIKCDRLIILATAIRSTVYRVALTIPNMEQNVHVSLFFLTVPLFVEMRRP